MDRNEAARIEKRILPCEDWDHAPAHIRSIALDTPTRALAYDMTFGWCVVDRSAEGPTLVYAEHVDGFPRRREP